MTNVVQTTDDAASLIAQLSADAVTTSPYDCGGSTPTGTIPGKRYDCYPARQPSGAGPAKRGSLTY